MDDQEKEEEKGCIEMVVARLAWLIIVIAIDASILPALAFVFSRV